MINRLPAWFKQEIPSAASLKKMRYISQSNIRTVCKEAKCPNFADCIKDSRLTFIILGNICTRNCKFCNVKKQTAAQLSGIDKGEPYRISRLVKELNLKYAVITSVSRDDLIDGGAGHFAKTINLIRSINKEIKVEALIPDFSGNIKSLETVIEAHPSVLAHNLETVSRLYKEVRPKADYELSLNVLGKAKKISPHLITKSSFILGLGEKENEVLEAMEDLRRVECDILTLGQYLAPSQNHYPAREFISLEKLNRYKEAALDLGFKAVLSGPLVRSSYQAEKTYQEAIHV